MAYKFQRGTFRASGSTVVEEGVTVDTGGLTVSAGTSALQAVTATTVTGTISQFTTLSASSLGGAAVSGLTAQYIPSWDAGLGRFENSFISRTGFGKTIISGALGLEVTGAFAVIGAASVSNGITVAAGGMSVTGGVQLANGLTVAGNFVANGNTTLGDTSSDVVTVNGQITGSLFAINGGAINGTKIGDTTQASAKFTTLSASGNTDIGGTLTVNGDLIVLGSTFSASVGTLLIEDKQIVLADGATSAAQAAGAGFFVSGANVEWTYKQNGEGAAASSGDIFVASGSTGLKSIQASTFYGTLVGSMASTVTGVGDADATLVVGVNYGTTVMTGSARTWTLPASAGLTAGQSVKVKAPSGLTSTRTITIQRAGSQTIDGETFIVLESDYAAVELVYVASDTWRVF